MPVRDDSPPGPADRCAECGHPLAHDQRYCVACGARRAALPPRVAIALSDLANPHRSAQPPPAAAASEETGVAQAPSEGRTPDLLPVARAAAVSILLMLGVGSLIGAATTPGGVTSLASTIVVALSPAHRAPPRPVALAPSGAGAGGAPASSGAGAGGTSPSAAPAPQAARTVTVSSSPTSTAAPATNGSTTTSSPTPTLPPIHHVWEIVLSGQGYDQSFGTTKGHPYLSKTLARQGTVITDYDAVATSPLANEIALVSGQGPTPQTLQDCPQYSDLTPGTAATHGQVRGDGCLYPTATQTLGSELQVQGDQWRAFIQGIGDPGQTAGTSTSTSTSSTSTGAATTSTAISGSTTASGSLASTTTSTPTTGAATTSTSTSTGGSTTVPVTDTSTATGCPHPSGGATDAGQATADDGYVTWKNPWVYFHAVLDSTTCAHADVGLGALAASLRRESTTPAFSYIAPDPCHDGSDTPCYPGAKSGLGQADHFLQTVLPEIERSAAYKADGLIVITFAEAPQSGPNWSTASCCGQPSYPNLKGASATPSSSTTSTTPSTSSTPTTSSTSTTSGAPAAGATTTATTSSTATTSCSSTASGTTTSTTSATPTTTTSTTSSGSSTTSSGSSTTTTSTCAPSITGDPPGGGQVGLLMISPYVPADHVDAVHIYNHFSLLKTVSDLLGVAPLGYAADSDVPALSPALFQQTKG